ncbi:hypothetical protein [Geodermatophilus sp. DSM 44513]|uniref:hypothetical protein n=1 Tax=Geodermatophilus sp. DSM 44513 TaxID=1528104 RepID=UPI0012817067|nr:hypothetical protein [Geodermatophilus sp. DSM 44513]WNV74344.1 hypothetical protein RTG05_15275 [Geodermatophilus sp. DSM 44513]
MSNHRKVKPAGTSTSESDKVIALYHRVFATEDFDTAADMIFQTVKKAAVEHAGKPRHLYLDIDGHRNDAGGFDHDMCELQKHFLIGYLMHWLTELHLPVMQGSAVRNPNQREDLPKHLNVLSGMDADDREEALRQSAAAAGAPVFDPGTGEHVAADGAQSRMPSEG